MLQHSHEQRTQGGAFSTARPQRRQLLCMHARAGVDAMRACEAFALQPLLRAPPLQPTHRAQLAAMCATDWPQHQRGVPVGGGAGCGCNNSGSARVECTWRLYVVVGWWLVRHARADGGAAVMWLLHARALGGHARLAARQHLRSHVANAAL